MKMAVLCVAAAAGMCSAQVGFMGTGAFGTQVYMSADGRHAVGGSGNSEPFTWSLAGGARIPQIPEGFSSLKYAGISRDGTAAGNTTFPRNGQRTVPFTWRAESGYQYYRDLGPQGEEEIASISGISRDGAAVVGVGRTNGRAYAVRWRNPQQPEILDNSDSSDRLIMATTANVNGTVIGGSSGFRAGIWTSAGVQMIGPVLNATQPRFVSDDGSVLAGDNGSAAWVWTAAEGYLPLQNAASGRLMVRVHSMSPDGTVLGGGLPGWNQNHWDQTAVYWTAETGTRLVADLLAEQGIAFTGWALRELNGISEDGRVLMGLGLNPSGRREVWRAELSRPIPAAGSLWVLVAAGCVAQRRRR